LSAGEQRAQLTCLPDAQPSQHVSGPLALARCTAKVVVEVQPIFDGTPDLHFVVLRCGVAMLELNGAANPRAPRILRLITIAYIDGETAGDERRAIITRLGNELALALT
jgi:hypothetical protein